MECCSQDSVKHCDVCPYAEKETDTYCVNCLIKDVLDLLARQKAERDALIAGQETLQKCIAEQKAELERLEGIADTLISHSPATSLARKQAIKEFAERLKEEKQWDVDIPDYVFVSYIDNLVKEMTEEKQNG